MMDGSGNDTANATLHRDICTVMANNDQCVVIWVIVWITSIVSILACCYIFLFMWYVQRKRNDQSGKQECSTEQLIQHVVIAVLLSTLHYLVDFFIAYESQSGGGIYCRFIGWFDQFTSWLPTGWVLVITIYIYWVIKYSKSPRGRYFVWTVWKVIGISALVISIVPFFVNGYGPSGLWCWIQTEKDGKSFTTGVVMQFLLYYVSSFIIFIIMGILMAYSCLKVKKRKKKVAEMCLGEKTLDDEIKPLIPLPWIYVACYLAEAMNRIRLAAYYDDKESGANVFFWVLMAFFPQSPGWIFAVWITYTYRHEVPSCVKTSPEWMHLLQNDHSTRVND